jgi:hypothetical protein
MSNYKSRQLIEHISDQYVLSAANPEQAFAREAEKRKKNRTKILAIACATAAVYVLIIVSILIGTRPDNPPEPPTPGTPGTENPGGTDITPPNQPNYTEPEINVPDAKTFASILKGRWKASYHNPHPYCLVFNHDGSVYIMDLNQKECETGLYSWEEDHIDIFTFSEDAGWQLSDISITKIEPQLEVTTPDGSYTCQRFTNANPYITLFTGTNAYNTTRYYVYNYYYERLETSGRPSDVYEFELPDFEIFEELEPLVFDKAPAFYGNVGKSSGHYAVYDEYGDLIHEQDCDIMRIGVASEDIPTIQIPDEDGLYYLDITYDLTDDFAEGFSRYLMHFYAVIQIGEGDGQEEPDTYTPPVLDDDRDILPIVNCDVKPGGMFTLDTTSPAEGKGCWATAMAPAIAFQKLETAIDATGCNVIEFDLYISDLGALEILKQECALELSSGGVNDVQEIAFTGEQIVEYGLYGQEWKVGWNHVVLRLEDAIATNGDGNVPFDISNVNFIRFYLLTATTSHTIKIDNICLSGKLTVSETPTTPPDKPIETPDHPPKDTTAPVEIFDCDTLPSFHGDFELDQTNMVEGNGCISVTVTGTTYTIMDLTFDPIDAEGCDVLEFDLYISDPELFKTGRFFTIELSSSVKQNVAELSFFGAAFFGLEPGQELKQGWNHVVLRLTDGKFQFTDKEEFNIRAINHLHIFLIENMGPPNGEYTVKIDNICLSKEVK